MSEIPLFLMSEVLLFLMSELPLFLMSEVPLFLMNEVFLFLMSEVLRFLMSGYPCNLAGPDLQSGAVFGSVSRILGNKIMKLRADMGVIWGFTGEG
jgi:hypothetical protein